MAWKPAMFWRKMLELLSIARLCSQAAEFMSERWQGCRSGWLLAVRCTDIDEPESSKALQNTPDSYAFAALHWYVLSHTATSSLLRPVRIHSPQTKMALYLSRQSILPLSRYTSLCPFCPTSLYLHIQFCIPKDWKISHQVWSLPFLRASTKSRKRLTNVIFYLPSKLITRKQQTKNMMLSESPGGSEDKRTIATMICSASWKTLSAYSCFLEFAY